MRSTAALHLALVFAMLAGCRLPHRDGPASESLVTSRQLSRQGLKAIQRGRWEQADALLAKAVRQCPDDPEARRHYAESLWHKGLQQEALDQLREAARLSCDDAALQTRMAEMQLALGQLGEAEQAVDQALKIDPHAARAWLVCGRLARTRGRNADAQAAFFRALHYTPEDSETLLDLAELYRQTDQPERALAVLQGLAGVCPPGDEPQQVLYLMGLAYSALGRYEDAADALAAASVREAPNADLLYKLAEAQLLSGRQAEAESSAQRALQIDPSHSASRELLTQIAFAQQAGTPLRR